MAVSHERSALIDFIAMGEPHKVGNYFAQNKKLQEDLQGFFDHEINMQALVSTFLSGDEEAVELTRDFLGQYFEVRGGKMPVGNLPFAARRTSSILEAKDNFKSGVHSLARGSVTKGTIDLTAAALSAAGLTVRERQLVMALFSTSAVTSILGLAAPAQAATTIQDVSSVMNSFNVTSHSQNVAETKQSAQTYEGEYMFSPYLINKLQDSPETHQYMNWIVDAADANGLDPVLFANQLFRESIHFSEGVIRGDKDSPAGAMGIAQFMRTTGKTYGLHSDEDFYNPKKSIYAAARMMSDLTEDYNGDLGLAMIAYNGGQKAIEFVEKALGKPEITSDEWINFMSIRRAQFGKTDPSAWHVETLDYIKGITGKDMTRDQRSWAANQQGNDPMQLVQSIISSNPALAAINRAAPTPMPANMRPNTPSNG